MKWVALTLLILGIAMIVHAWHSDRTSSFEDGTFMIQIIEVVAGVTLVLASAVLSAILFFS